MYMCVCVHQCMYMSKVRAVIFWHTLQTDSHWLMSAKANKVRQFNRFSYMSHSTIQRLSSLSHTLSLSNYSVVGSEFCSVAVPALPARHKGFTDLLLTLGATSSRLIKHCTHLHFKITPSKPSLLHIPLNLIVTICINIIEALF